MSIYRNALIRLNTIRLVSAAVILAFAAQDLAWAGAELRSGTVIPGPAAASSSAAVTLGSVIADPSLLPIPAGQMMFRERSAGRNGRLILHVQDAHANYAAQKNIASSLGYWMDRFPQVRLVAVEGGSGDGSLDRFRESAPAGLWKRAAAQLLRDGAVTGEEFLNLTSDRPMRIWGVEDQELYDRNRAVYARVAALRPGLQPALRRTRTAVEALKSRMYPQPVLDHESVIASAGSAAWDYAARSEALGRLPAAARPAAGKYPAWEAWEALRAEEARSDGDLLRREMGRLMDVLPAEHPALAALHAVPAADPASALSVWNSIADAALEASNGQVKPGEELRRYLERLERLLRLDTDALAQAADRIEQDAYAALLNDPDAVRLREADRYLTLLENAAVLKLDGAQTDALTAGMRRFPSRHWIAWLNRKLADLGLEQHWIGYDRGTDRALREVREFYELAVRRDAAFVENLDAALTRSGDAAAFLIAGGYHSSNIVRLLKEKGYAFAVCAPVTDEETDWEVYEKNLLGRDFETKDHRAAETSRQRGAASRSADGIRQPFAAKALTARMASSVNRPAVSEAAKYLSAAADPPAAVTDPDLADAVQAARLSALQRAARSVRVWLAKKVFWRQIGRWTEFSALLRTFAPAEGHVVSLADTDPARRGSEGTAAPFAARVIPLTGGAFRGERVVEIEDGGLRHPIYYGIGWRSAAAADPVVSYQGTLDPRTPQKNTARIRSLIEIVRRIGASETLVVDRASPEARDRGAIDGFAGMSRASWPRRSIITARPTPFHALIDDQSAASAGSRYWTLAGTGAGEIARRTGEAVELLEYFGLPYHLIFSSDTRGGSLPSPTQRHLLRVSIAVPSPASRVTAAQAAGYFLYPDQQGFRADFPVGTDAFDGAASALSAGLVPAPALIRRLRQWRSVLTGFTSRITDLEAVFTRGARPRHRDLVMLKRELHRTVRSINRTDSRSSHGASGYRAKLLVLLHRLRELESALRAPRRHQAVRAASATFWEAVFRGVRILGSGPLSSAERPVRIKVVVMTNGDRTGASWEAVTDTENLAAEHSVVSHRDLAVLRRGQMPAGTPGNYLAVSVFYVPSVRLEGETLSRPQFLMDIVPGSLTREDPYYVEPALAVEDFNRLLRTVHRAIPHEILSDTWVDMSRMKDKTFSGVVDALERDPRTVRRTVIFPWTGLEEGKPAQNRVLQFSSVAGALDPSKVDRGRRLNAARMSARSENLEKRLSRTMGLSAKLHAVDRLVQQLDSLERHAGKGLEAGSHGYKLGRARIAYYRELTRDFKGDPDIAFVDQALSEAGLAEDGALEAVEGILPDMLNYEEYERQVAFGRELRDAAAQVPLRRAWIEAVAELSGALASMGAGPVSTADEARSRELVRRDGTELIVLLSRMLPFKMAAARKALERAAPARELDAALEELEALRQVFAALWEGTVIDWLRSSSGSREPIESIAYEFNAAMSEWRRIGAAFEALDKERRGKDDPSQMEFDSRGFRATRNYSPPSVDGPFDDLFEDERNFRRILRERFEIEHERWNKYSAAMRSWALMEERSEDLSVQTLALELEAHHGMLTAADGAPEVFWDVAARALAALDGSRVMRARLRAALRRKGAGTARVHDLKAGASAWDPRLAGAEPGLWAVLAALQLSYERRLGRYSKGEGPASLKNRVPVTGLGASSGLTRERNRADLDRTILEAWLDEHRISWIGGLGRLIRAKARWTHLAQRARQSSKDRAALDAQLITDAADFVKKNLGSGHGVYSVLAQEIHLKLAVGQGDPGAADELRRMILDADREQSTRRVMEESEAWMLKEVEQTGESADRAREILLRPGVWHLTGKKGEAAAYRKSVQYANRLLDLLRADAVMVRVLAETGRLDAAEKWLDAAEKLWPAVFLAVWSLEQSLRSGEPSGADHAQVSLRKLIRQERRLSGLWNAVIDKAPKGKKGDAVRQVNRLTAKVSRNLVWPALLLALDRRAAGDLGILVPAVDAASELSRRIAEPLVRRGASEEEIRDHTRSILEALADSERERLRIFGFSIEGSGPEKEDQLDEVLRSQGLGQEALRRMLEPYEDAAAGSVPIHHERRQLRWIVVRLALAADHLKPPPASGGARLATMAEAKAAILRLQEAQKAITDALEKTAVSKKKELGHQVATSVVALLTDRFVNRPDDPLRRLLQAVKEGQVRASDMAQIGEELEVDYLMVSMFLDPDSGDRLADWIGSFTSSEAPALPNEARMMLEVFSQGGYYEVFKPLFEEYAARAKELFTIPASLPLVADDPNQQALDQVQRLINEALPAPRNVRLLYAPDKFRVNPNAALPGVDPERARGFGLGIDRLRWGQFFHNPLGEERKSRLLYHVREPGNIDWPALAADIEQRIPEAAGSAAWEALKRRWSGARMGVLPDIEDGWGWDEPTPDETFRTRFGPRADEVLQLAVETGGAKAAVKSWSEKRVAAFDLFGLAGAMGADAGSERWVRFTDRVDLEAALVDGREVPAALYVKYLGDPHGTPIPKGSGPGPNSRISMESEYEHTRLAHAAGRARASVLLDGQLVTAASPGRETADVLEELRRQPEAGEGYLRLAEEIGSALGDLHGIHRRSPHQNEMEYLLHQDLMWMQGGVPVGIKEHIRHLDDGRVEFIDLGSSAFRPDRARLDEREQLRAILLQLIPVPDRSAAAGAFDAAYDKAFSAAQRVPGPFDHLWEGARMATAWMEPFNVPAVFRKNLDIPYRRSAMFEPGAGHLLVERPVQRLDPGADGSEMSRYERYQLSLSWDDELRARYEFSGNVLTITDDGWLIVSTGQGIERRRVSDGELLEGSQYAVAGAVGAVVVNGHTLAVLADGGRSLLLLDERRGVIATFESGVQRPSGFVPMAFSPATGMLAMGFYHTVRLLDLSSLTPEGVLSAQPKVRMLERENQIGEPLSEYALAVAFSPDGRWLAVGSEDQLVHLWNVAEGRIAVQLQEADGKVHAVTFTRDNRLFAAWTSTESARESVRAWQMDRIFPSASGKPGSEGARMSAKETDFIDGVWGGWLEAIRRRSDKSGDRPVAEFAKAIDAMAGLTDPAAAKGPLSPVNLIGSLMFDASGPDPVGMALSFNERSPRVYAGTVSTADMNRVWAALADAGLRKQKIPFSRFKSPTFDRSYFEEYQAPGSGNSGIFWKKATGSSGPAPVRSVEVHVSIQPGALENGGAGLVVEIAPDANLSGKDRLRLFELAARHMDRVLSGSAEASGGRWNVVRMIPRSSVERIFDLLPARDFADQGGAREAMRSYLEKDPVKSWVFGRPHGARMALPSALSRNDFDHFKSFDALKRSGRVPRGIISRVPKSFGDQIAEGYYVKKAGPKHAVYVAYSPGATRLTRRLKTYRSSLRSGFDNVVEHLRLDDGTLLTRLAESYTDAEIAQRNTTLEDMFLYILVHRDPDHGPRDKGSEYNLHKRVVAVPGGHAVRRMIYDLGAAGEVWTVDELEDLAQDLIRFKFIRPMALDRDRVLDRLEALTISRASKDRIAAIVRKHLPAGARMAGMAERLIGSGSVLGWTILGAAALLFWWSYRVMIRSSINTLRERYPVDEMGLLSRMSLPDISINAPWTKPYGELWLSLYSVAIDMPGHETGARRALRKMLDNVLRLHPLLLNSEKQDAWREINPLLLGLKGSLAGLHQSGPNAVRWSQQSEALLRKAHASVDHLLMLMDHPFGARMAETKPEQDRQAMALLKQQFAELGPEAIRRLRPIRDIGELRTSLTDEGVTAAGQLRGKFLFEAWTDWVSQLGPDQAQAKRVTHLKYEGNGRHLIAYSAEDFPYVLKMNQDPDLKRFVRLQWIDNGLWLARERLGGLAAPTMAVDVESNPGQKPFVYLLERAGEQTTDVAIVQKKVVPLVEHLKELVRSGRLEDAKRRMDEYKRLTVAMFRRGVVDTDFGGILANYGVDEETDRLVVFDFGDLAGGITNAYELTDFLEYATNAYIESGLRSEVDDELADYFKENAFTADDFTEDGRYLFEADMPVLKPEELKMEFPLDEKEVREYFSHHRISERPSAARMAESGDVSGARADAPAVPGVPAIVDLMGGHRAASTRMEHVGSRALMTGWSPTRTATAFALELIDRAAPGRLRPDSAVLLVGGTLGELGEVRKRYPRSRVAVLNADRPELEAVVQAYASGRGRPAGPLPELYLADASHWSAGAIADGGEFDLVYAGGLDQTAFASNPELVGTLQNMIAQELEWVREDGIIYHPADGFWQAFIEAGVARPLIAGDTDRFVHTGIFVRTSSAARMPAVIGADVLSADPEYQIDRIRELLADGREVLIQRERSDGEGPVRYQVREALATGVLRRALVLERVSADGAPTAERSVLKWTSPVFELGTKGHIAGLIRFLDDAAKDPIARSVLTLLVPPGERIGGNRGDNLVHMRHAGEKSLEQVSDPLEWLGIVDKLAQGLAYLETEYAFRHGDLIPKNIAVADGRPSLIDYDSARIAIEISDGEPALWAPGELELVRKKDVFDVGKLLKAALAAEADAELRAALEPIVRKALLPNAHPERYQNMAELSADLRRVLPEPPAAARMAKGPAGLTIDPAEVTPGDAAILAFGAMTAGESVMLDWSKWPAASTGDDYEAIADWIRAFSGDLASEFREDAELKIELSGGGPTVSHYRLYLFIREMLKNAFVHGNALRQDLPIVLRSESRQTGDGPLLSTFEVRDTAQAAPAPARLMLAAKGHLWGHGAGESQVLTPDDEEAGKWSYARSPVAGSGPLAQAAVIRLTEKFWPLLSGSRMSGPERRDHRIHEDGLVSRIREFVPKWNAVPRDSRSTMSTPRARLLADLILLTRLISIDRPDAIPLLKEIQEHFLYAMLDPDFEIRRMAVDKAGTLYERYPRSELLDQLLGHLNAPGLSLEDREWPSVPEGMAIEPGRAYRNKRFAILAHIGHMSLMRRAAGLNDWIRAQIDREIGQWGSSPWDRAERIWEAGADPMALGADRPMGLIEAMILEMSRFHRLPVGDLKARGSMYWFQRDQMPYLMGLMQESGHDRVVDALMEGIQKVRPTADIAGWRAHYQSVRQLGFKVPPSKREQMVAKFDRLIKAETRLQRRLSERSKIDAARMAEDASAGIITAAPRTLYRTETGFDPELLDRLVAEINGRIGSGLSADLTARVVGGIRYTGNMNRRDLDLSIEGSGGNLKELLPDILAAVDAAVRSLDPNARAVMAEPDPFGLHNVPGIDVELAGDQSFSIDLFESWASEWILRGMRRALQIIDPAIEAWKNERGSTAVGSSSAGRARHVIQMAALKRVLLGVYVYGKPDEWRYLARQFAALESSGLDTHDVAELGTLDPAWFEAVSFLRQKLNVTSWGAYSDPGADESIDPKSDESLIRDLNLSNARPLEQVVSAARMAEETVAERPIYRSFGALGIADASGLAAAAQVARRNGMRGPAPVLLKSADAARMAYTVVPEDVDVPVAEAALAKRAAVVTSGPSTSADEPARRPLDIAARISDKYDQILSLLEREGLMPTAAVPLPSVANKPVEVVVTLAVKDLSEADTARWREAVKEQLSAVRQRLSEKGIRLAVDLALTEKGLADALSSDYAPDPKLAEHRVYVRTPEAKGTRDTLNFYMEPAGYADGAFHAAPLAETALLAAAVVRTRTGRSLWSEDAMNGILPAWKSLVNAGREFDRDAAYTVLIGIASPSTNAAYAAKAWRVGPRLAALIEVLRLGARMAAIAA
jgi:WD40 repeat protein